MNKKTARLKLILVSLIGIMIMACTMVVLIPADWYVGLVEIDGDDADWYGKWVLPPESPVAFAVKNHSETLYLAFKTTNEEVIRQAGLNGFVVLIDSKGGQTGRYGLRFEAPQLPVRAMSQTAASVRRQFVDSQIQMSLNGPISVKSSDGQGNIQPVVYRGHIISKYSQGQWFCEASIPLTALKRVPKYGDKLGVGLRTIPRKPDEAFSLYVNYPELSQPGIYSGPWWVKVQLAQEPILD